MVNSDVSSICNIYLTSAGKVEKMVGKGGERGGIQVVRESACTRCTCLLQSA